MSDTVSRKALIEWLKDKEQQALEEFERTDRRFCSGEHSAFEDVREMIESGNFESKPDYKAITELAVKSLNLEFDVAIASQNKYAVTRLEKVFLEIERLQNE